jgi:hypothetical protein
MVERSLALSTFMLLGEMASTWIIREDGKLAAYSMCQVTWTSPADLLARAVKAPTDKSMWYPVHEGQVSAIFALTVFPL